MFSLDNPRNFSASKITRYMILYNFYSIVFLYMRIYISISV